MKGYGPTVVEITAIGESKVLAKRSYDRPLAHPRRATMSAVIPESATPNLSRNTETGEWLVIGYSLGHPEHSHILATVKTRSTKGKRLWLVECTCGWTRAPAHTAATVLGQGKVQHLDRIGPDCPTPGKATYQTETIAHRALLRVWRKAPGELVPIRAYECRCRKWHLTSKDDNSRQIS